MEKSNYNSWGSNINYKFEYRKFCKIQTEKLKLIDKKRYFSHNKILYLILDIRKLKTKIIAFNKKKCLFSLTNGFIFKKMNLKIKKNKKSEKTTNLLLKSLNLKGAYFLGYKKIIVYVKGIKKYINNVIKYINLTIRKKNKNSVIYLLNYKISRSKNFGFKKVKAIKRKLKKKIIKLK